MTEKAHIKPKDSIFCRTQGVTKEHIIADWLKEYLPKDKVNYQSQKGTLYPTETVADVKTRGGDFGSRTVKCVCETCNNGWMSQLQNAARPLVIAMLKGAVTLSTEDQANLSAWIAMAVIASEYDYPEHVSISPEDREYLLKQKKPPSTWRIWIGNFERKSWPAHWVHHPVAIEKMPYNTQTTTYTIGNIFIHVISSSTWDVNKWNFSDREMTKGLIEICPSKGNVSWPVIPPVHDKEADFIASDFFNRMAKLITDPKNRGG